MNTYEKQGEGVQLLLTRNPTRISYPEEHRDEGPLLGIPVLNPLRAEE